MRTSIMWSFTLIAAMAPALAGAEVLTVAPRPVSDEKAVFATVESISVVPARSQIGGTVAQLHVREDDYVTRGQDIAVVGDEKLVLQTKSLDAQIEALQAHADRALIDFDRIERLVERGTLPRLDEARAPLNVALHPSCPFCVRNIEARESAISTSQRDEAKQT